MSLVNVRYMVDDVDAAIAFYTTHLGFRPLHARGARLRGRHARRPPAPAQRANQLGRPPHARWAPARAGRLESHPLDRGRHRGRGGAAAGRRSAVPQRHRARGPGGAQVLIEDPSGNPIELFQPAAH